MSAAMQNYEKSSGAKIDVFASGFGDIKLMKKDRSRFYYCYSEQGGFLYLRNAGTADYNEVLYFNARLLADESWPNGAKVFTDSRWADSSPFSFDSLHQLSRDIALQNERTGRYPGDVVMFCSNDFEFGMHRMFDMAWKDDGLDRMTHRDLDAAVESLGIDRELLDEIIAEVDKIEASLNSF